MDCHGHHLGNANSRGFWRLGTSAIALKRTTRLPRHHEGRLRLRPSADARDGVEDSATPGRDTGTSVTTDEFLQVDKLVFEEGVKIRAIQFGVMWVVLDQHEGRHFMWTQHICLLRSKCQFCWEAPVTVVTSVQEVCVARLSIVAGSMLAPDNTR